MEPVVTTKAGAVRSVRGAFGSHVFLGIPYALPPLGELRYLAPVPARWDGVRDADRYGATAPQPEHGMTLIPEPIIPGDDFLHLNVVTPDPGAAGLPVLVWIHGGGFTSGCNASPWYRGERFARDGVVVVAINYRLGAEGFLALDGAPANRALLDWIAALRWVQDNIAAFGGDPARVTIAGQSAGGGACGTLLAVPEARGLFRAAIPMSGAAQMTIPAKRAQEFAARFAEAQGVPPTRSAFAALSVSEVVATQQRLTAMGSGAPIEPATLGRRIVEGLLPLAPSVDGDLLPASPIAMIRDGAGAGVPVLVGNTTEEFGMLAATSLAGADQAGLASALAAMGLPDDRATHYLSDSRPPALVLAQAVTDRTFRIPSVRLAEAHPPTWVYE
ncbi:MAG: carboxylesterase family protein, partial [Acidimicrobiaceae bacterium]|nr:carboxylesterase family protein [Acidimicrobiaceae bacterium]